MQVFLGHAGHALAAVTAHHLEGVGHLTMLLEQAIDLGHVNA